MKLFRVKHADKKKVKQAGIDCPFKDKQAAKRARDAAGGVDAGFTVTKAEEHWKYDK